MKKIKVYQIDAFTKEKFKGNPAGVVVNADGMTDMEMQRVARELNNSETAFLFSPDNAECDGVIRYFTPTREVPICGHATIAAMVAYAIENKLNSCVLKFKTNIGILPFEIIHEKGSFQVIMTQGQFELSRTLQDEITEKILSALGLDKSNIDDKCPVQIASTGHSKVMIGIKSRNKLNELTPDFSKLAALSTQLSCNGYFVFTFDSIDPEILTYGRMFAPAIGINEDPVTGNANGPLGGYLIQNKIVEYNNNLFEFSGKQGEKIDRPGVISVRVKIENELPVLIQIKGEATVIFKTEIEFE